MHIVTGGRALPPVTMGWARLGVDASHLGRFGDAAHGQKVGAEAEIAVLLPPLGIDGIEAAHHDLFQAPVDLVLGPEEALEILDPLEVADGHAASIG